MAIESIIVDQPYADDSDKFVEPDPDAMTEPLKPVGRESERAARLRDALRENLKRRKSQARGRAALDAQPITKEPAPAGAGAEEDPTAPKL